MFEFWLVLAVGRAIAAGIAAILFFNVGQELTSLESIRGGTVDEAFYQQIGYVSYGLSAFAVAIGIPTSFSPPKPGPAWRAPSPPETKAEDKADSTAPSV